MLRSTISSVTLMMLTICDKFEARIIEGSCVKRTKMFGNSEDDDPEYGFVDGDLADIGDMSLMQVAYSRPTSILVCANDSFVHGVRITLKMHPSEPTDHADMEEFQDDIQKLNQYIDKQSSIYEQFHMKMVGTYTTPCLRLDIADKDKINYVKLVADEEKLRGIHVHLASGEMQSWGQHDEASSNFQMREHRHDLSDKIDLLGLFGYIKRVPAGPQSFSEGENGVRDEYIVALGFI